MFHKLFCSVHNLFCSVCKRFCSVHNLFCSVHKRCSVHNLTTCIASTHSQAYKGTISFHSCVFPATSEMRPRNPGLQKFCKPFSCDDIVRLRNWFAVRNEQITRFLFSQFLNADWGLRKPVSCNSTLWALPHGFPSVFFSFRTGGILFFVERRKHPRSDLVAFQAFFETIKVSEASHCWHPRNVTGFEKFGCNCWTFFHQNDDPPSLFSASSRPRSLWKLRRPRRDWTALQNPAPPEWTWMIHITTCERNVVPLRTNRFSSKRCKVGARRVEYLPSKTERIILQAAKAIAMGGNASYVSFFLAKPLVFRSHSNVDVSAFSHWHDIAISNKKRSRFIVVHRVYPTKRISGDPGMWIQYPKIFGPAGQIGDNKEESWKGG